MDTAAVPGTVGEHGFDAALDPMLRHRKVRSPTKEAAGNLQRNGEIRGSTDSAAPHGLVDVAPQGVTPSALTTRTAP